MNEPRISRREKKLHLSYDLPNRIHCSAIYPLPAPNGSEVIIYGHDRGLRVLWRGGNRRKESAGRSAARSRSNGADHGVIDDDVDDIPQWQDGAHDQEDSNEYDDFNEEDDPDCAYPHIIQDLDIPHDSPVLHIAVPSISPTAAAQLSQYARDHIIVAQVCANGEVSVKALPLEPPTTTEKQHNRRSFYHEWLGECVSNPRSLALKIVPNQEYPHGCQLLVATGGASLSLWELHVRRQDEFSSRELLRQSGWISAVAFPFSRSQDRLLVSERSGAVRVFDPSQTSSTNGRPTSKDSGTSGPVGGEVAGRWIMSYSAPFRTSHPSPTSARRKNVLATAWVLSGRAILVLLEDGEWGVWDMQGATQAGKNVEDFALRGYLGSSAPAESAESGKQKKLAPMTPNTRRTKSDNLFSGPEKVTGVAPSGCITVSPTGTRSGATDESVIIYYNNEIYSISSMQNFWQRSTSNSAGGIGSLYTPGLTHVTDINLMNENITSISQFASKSMTGTLGQMNVSRDLLVSTESRFIILQHLASPTASRGLFQQVAEQPTMQDQRMLDAGELDLGGMDRMLDGMAGGAKPRRVGFAH